jgi:hypothetical protein
MRMDSASNFKNTLSGQGVSDSLLGVGQSHTKSLLEKDKHLLGIYVEKVVLSSNRSLRTILE